MKRRSYCFVWIISILSCELLIFSACDKNGNANMPVLEPPEVTSQTVTEIYSTGATLNAKIKTGDLKTKIAFEYGTSLSYGNTVSGEPDTKSKNETSVKANITSLIKGTRYHFRVKAENSVGITYGNDIVFTAKFGLGEAYGGGFIIYLDESGQHGLVAAETDQSEGSIWDNGTNCKKTNVTSTVFGNGQPNTTRIVNVLGLGSYPAKICDDLVMNGYSDWFLPTLQEFDCLKKSLSAFDVRYNLNGQFYWTSSEAVVNDTQSCFTWVQNIYTGEQRTWDKYDKTPFVRAVRAF